MAFFSHPLGDFRANVGASYIGRWEVPVGNNWTFFGSSYVHKREYIKIIAFWRALFWGEMLEWRVTFPQTLIRSLYNSSSESFNTNKLYNRVLWIEIQLFMSHLLGDLGVITDFILSSLEATDRISISDNWIFLLLLWLRYCERKSVEVGIFEGLFFGRKF